MSHIFIDDERLPPEGKNWIVLRSSKSSIDWMEENGCPDFISFDHDLGGDDTARIDVSWLIEKDLDIPGFIGEHFSFYVHSQNPVGAKYIEDTLNGYMQYRQREREEEHKIKLSNLAKPSH